MFRFKQVTKIVPFSMFLPSLWLSFLRAIAHRLRGSIRPTTEILRLPCFGFPKPHVSAHVFAVSLCPAAHASSSSHSRCDVVFDCHALYLARGI
jgi:hypothetical protein